MEPRRTQLCMLSDMLSSCLTLIVKHCNTITYQWLFGQIRATEERKRARTWGGFREGDRGEMECRMTPDRHRRGVLSARAGWLARMLSLLDPELL